MLDPEGPAFEVELPTGELVERGRLPVVDGDAVGGDCGYNNSNSRNNGTCARVLAFPHDRAKRSQQSAKQGRIILRLTLPFDRGKDCVNCSMKYGGLRAWGYVVLE